MNTTTRQANPFRTARKAKPTLKHRPAIWECMLGTVYARSDAGETKYFDYDWDAARAFANVEGRDLRVAKAPSGWGGTFGPSKGQMVLFVGPPSTS